MCRPMKGRRFHWGVGADSPDVVFGNSIHDAAMLAIAKRAFPVNSTPALLQIAGDKGWPVFYPAGSDQ